MKEPKGDGFAQHFWTGPKRDRIDWFFLKLSPELKALVEARRSALADARTQITTTEPKLNLEEE